MSSHHIVTPKTYGTVLVILAVLMALTCAFAKFEPLEFDSYAMNLGIALLIAGVKTFFVMSFFMHVKFSSKLVKVFAITAPLFMIIFFALVFSDYVTREGADWWSPLIEGMTEF